MSKQMVMGLMCMVMLAMSGAAMGYSIDGTLDSADFGNLLGPYGMGYPKWSYEGGTVGAPLDDIQGNILSAYDSIPTYYSSDGDIMTHTPDETTASFSTGFYKAWNNHYYLPSGSENNYAKWGQTTNDADGFTIEWRAKMTNTSAWGLTNGYYFGFNVDECANLWARIGGYNDTDSVAKFTGGVSVAIDDVREWHNYRWTVLGDDGTGTIRANFYQDQTLVIEELAVGTAGTTDGLDYMWNGVEWGYEIAGGVHTVQYDYIRIDATGAWAPVPEPTTLLLLGGGLVGLLRRRK